MKKRKVITVIALVLGVAIALAGLIILSQAGASHTGYNGGLSRASTSIEFGGDFYTTSAQYTGLAANAVSDLYKLVSIATGIFFMFVGGMDICATLLFADIKEVFRKKPVETEPVETNAAE